MSDPTYYNSWKRQPKSLKGTASPFAYEECATADTEPYYQTVVTQHSTGGAYTPTGQPAHTHVNPSTNPPGSRTPVTGFSSFVWLLRQRLHKVHKHTHTHIEGRGYCRALGLKELGTKQPLTPQRTKLTLFTHRLLCSWRPCVQCVLFLSVWLHTWLLSSFPQIHTHLFHKIILPTPETLHGEPWWLYLHVEPINVLLRPPWSWRKLELLHKTSPLFSLSTLKCISPHSCTVWCTISASPAERRELKGCWGGCCTEVSNFSLADWFMHTKKTLPAFRNHSREARRKMFDNHSFLNFKRTESEQEKVFFST